jgi:hypothetical protein
VIYFPACEKDPVPDDAILSSFLIAAHSAIFPMPARPRRSIGQAFELMIPVGRVSLKSLCRSLDTAQIAFGKATSEPVLENLETAENEVEREARIEGLRRLLSTVPNGRRTASWSVMVSISPLLRRYDRRGEAAIFLPEERGFTLVATVTSGEWEELGSQFAFRSLETYRLVPTGSSMGARNSEYCFRQVWLPPAFSDLIR